MDIVIGNIVALLASLLMFYTGVLKDKKSILSIQSLQMFLFVVSNAILGGITGAITNAVGIVRNILCYKNKLNTLAKIIISFFVIFLSLYFDKFMLIRLLPLISTLSYLWLMNIKDIVKFKILIVYTLVLWAIYDIYIMSYTSALFDILCIISNLITMDKLYKNKKKVS